MTNEPCLSDNQITPEEGTYYDPVYDDDFPFPHGEFGPEDPPEFDEHIGLEDYHPYF